MIPSRPESDAGYLESSSRIIFMGGLNRQVVDNKWEGFLAAFEDFDPEKVSEYGPDDIERLAQDNRIIKYKAKLKAVVKNAQTMQDLAEAHGSFGSYVDALYDEKGLEAASKALAKQFSYVSEQGAIFWLYGTGHDIGEVSPKNQAKYAPFGTV
jgi:3-methyladenine DNA glycosylase Tag